MFRVDKNGKVTYAEVVKEVTEHPNYDAAIAALKAAADKGGSFAGARFDVALDTFTFISMTFICQWLTSTIECGC